MLSKKRLLRFYTVKAVSLVTITLALLLYAAATGADNFALASNIEAANFNQASQPLPTVSPTVEVRIGEPTITDGSGATVPITISGSVTGVTAYEIFISFDDTKLNFVSCDTTGTLSDGLISPGCGVVVPGSGELHIFGTGSALSGSSGTLLNLNFTENANPGEFVSIEFDPWGTPTDPVVFYDGTVGHPPAWPLFDGGIWLFGAQSGTITYGNAIGSPTTRYVSNVTVTATGGPTPMSTTTVYPDGTYYLDRFVGGYSYSVSPTKTGGVNGSITSNDAARASQCAAGSPPCNATQIIVCDVSNNGSCSSTDASYIATYAAGSCGTCGITGTWKWDPAKYYFYNSGEVTGADYLGLLMGEVTGNWANSNSRPANGPVRNTAVLAPNLTAAFEKEVTVPISVEQATDKEIISFEFDLRYDPSVIQPAENVISLAKTVSGGLTAIANAKEPGVLRVVVYGPLPISDDGLLLNLRFMAVGAPGSLSLLALENFMFNEGDPKATVTNGQVEISAAILNTTAVDR